jgi:hypothetical protein
MTGMSDSSKVDLVSGHFQWPRSADRQKVATLFALHAAEFQVSQHENS